MTVATYDWIVVGSGAANTVTETLVRQGRRVALVERGKFGGTCLTRGCIPTKVMVAAADVVEAARRFFRIGVEGCAPRIDWETVSRRVWNRINQCEDLRRHYEEMEGVDVFAGEGRFCGPHRLQVTAADGSVREIGAPHILLAVGGRSRIPSEEEAPGLADVAYWTSEDFFGAQYPYTLPPRLMILGGGAIGTEFAHALAAAGVEVTLVHRSAHILSREEPEIAAAVQRGLEAAGGRVLTDQKTLAVTETDGIKRMELEDKRTGERRTIAAEALLVAAGIVPNTDTLGLEHTGVETDARGYILTNEFLETSAAGIYALGDVNGEAPLRHRANYEADILAHNLTHDDPHDWRWARYDVVPVAVFTAPEVARVGLTEAEAKKTGRELHIAYHRYADTAKGFAMGISEQSDDNGMIKLIADHATDRLLGVSIVGPHATVLLQPFVNLMNVGTVPLCVKHAHIASPAATQLRQEKPVRELRPDSVIAVGETMTPHPGLAEVAMWTQYYYEGKI